MSTPVAPPPARASASPERAPGDRVSADGRAGAGADGPLMVFLPAPLRLVAVTLLALVVGRRWAHLTDPAVAPELLRGTGVAAAAAVLALGAGRLHGRRTRLAAALALVAATLAGALLVAGVPLWMLDPRDWGSLAPRLGGGLDAVPNLRVPYRGEDDWVRITIALGGVLLQACAAVLAVAGRGRPVAAAGLLAATYTVASAEVEQAQTLGDGVLLLVLVALLVLGERVPMHRAGAAAGVLAVVAAAGVAALPALDRADPWVDYRALTEKLGDRPAARFDWSHGYGPLPWKRDGRLVLRVAAPRAAYWKAVTLDGFDGTRWRRGTTVTPGTTPGERSPRRAWTTTVSVSVRDLRSRQLYAPGEILVVERSSARVRTDTPGTVVTTGRPIARGDNYRVKVYSPQPGERELAAAGTDYPPTLAPALEVTLPRATGRRVTPVGRAGTIVRFAPFGTGAPPIAFGAGGLPVDAGAELARSPYARTWALAQRLLARSSTPREYVRRVEAYLADGFAYDERPPAARVPLESFLFDTRRGYCQQFSGAMALLLRMGGVPARVAEGFAPGLRDLERRDFAVRDRDAHSWVEVYVPHIGWTTEDPTPAVAPPVTQLTPEEEAAQDTATAGAGGDDAVSSADRGDTGAAATAVTSGGEDRGTPWPLLALLAAGVLAAGTGAVLAARRRATPADSADAALAELRRALRRSGRAAGPGTTLAAVAAGLAAQPAAAAYVRALARARYATPGAPHPVAADRSGRRALRRALAGPGVRGWLRGLRVLPPRLRG